MNLAYLGLLSRKPSLDFQEEDSDGLVRRIGSLRNFPRILQGRKEVLIDIFTRFKAEMHKY